MANSEPPAGSASSSVRLRIAAGLVGLVVLGGAAAVWYWHAQTAPAPTVDDEDDIERVLNVVNPGYVGIEACATCHTQRAATFKTTRHYLACLPASGVAAPGFEPGRGGYDIRGPGLHFEMTRTADGCLATSVQAAPKGDKRTTYQVALVYGSANRRDEMYFAWQDDQLVHLPAAWLYPQNRWGNAAETRHVGSVPPSCLECHNTWAAYKPGSNGRYRKDDMILGVTCERCHGPGEAHVFYHTDHPKSEAHAILHPGTLSRERLMDVCAQCHGNTRLLTAPFSYRPGEPLETVYHTVRAKYREVDTTTNQVQYLGESKCFQKSEMTCITCHDPHRPRSALGGCLKCHTAASCTDQPRQPAAVRGDCVGCHMPQHIWMNSHYYTTADDDYVPVAPRSEHRIAVYPEAKQAVLLAWLRKQNDAENRAEADRVAAELTEYWLKQAEVCRREDRLKAAIGAYREALQITQAPATRQRLREVIARQAEFDDLVHAAAEVDRRDPARLIGHLQKILDRKPDDARTHGELGTIFAMMGKRNEAIPHLNAVVRHDPNNGSGMTRLAWMAHVEGRPYEAAALCAEAEKVEPGQPMNYFVWGMALAKLERWPDAEKRFRVALKIDPTHAGANQGVSDALRHQGQAQEAVRFARRAVHWSDPNNAEVLLTLADAYVAAKRVADARKTLEQAQTIAAANNPPLADAIRKRLRELE
jgi:tetratricopeptide (TPR) repeat protein